MNELAKKSKTVSWKETREITVGYDRCISCNKRTPEPTTEQLLEFAHTMTRNHDYLWPSEHPPGFKPVAWSYFKGQHHTGWLCFDCTMLVNRVIGAVDKQ